MNYEKAIKTDPTSIVSCHVTESCRKSLTRHSGQSRPDQQCTSPFQAESWSLVTKCNPGKRQFCDIFLCNTPAHQLNDCRTRILESITRVIRSSILTSSTSRWWPGTIIRESVTSSERCRPRSLPPAPSQAGGGKQSSTREELMKWENGMEMYLIILFLSRSFWCPPPHLVQPTQSTADVTTAVVTTAADVTTAAGWRDRKHYPQTRGRRCREPGSCPRSVPRQLCQNRSSRNNSPPESLGVRCYT